MDLIDRCAWFNLADPEFGRKLLIALLRTAAEQEGVCGERSAAALAGVPEIGGYMKMKARRPFRPVLSLRDHIQKWLYEIEPPGSFMEWVWEGGPITIAVRVDLDQRSYDDRPALESCMKTLKRQGMPIHGLLILSCDPREQESLPSEKRKQFLGAITWGDAEERLRAIRPESTLAREEWDGMLDDLCAPAAAER